MPGDEYHMAGRGGLKLKSSAKAPAKPKKHKKSGGGGGSGSSGSASGGGGGVVDQRLMQEVRTGADPESGRRELERQAVVHRAQRTKTRAEMAFEKQRETNNMKRIMKKASQTHKQRVEDFNRHLDALSDHYDIPKVSWTK